LDKSESAAICLNCRSLQLQTLHLGFILVFILSLSATIRRYSRLWIAFFKQCLAKDMQYRLNFFLVFVMDIVWYAVNLGFFEVIYLNTDNIAGYGRNEVFFFMATLFVIDALDMTLFSSSLWVMNDLIRKGDFDLLLTKPIAPLFYASARDISLGSLFDSVFAFGLLAYVWASLAPTVSLLDVAAYLALLLCGLMTMYSIQVFFASLGFIFVNASTSLQWGFHYLYQLAMKPEAIYKGLLRYVLMYLIPMIAIGSLPASMIIKGFDAQNFLLGVCTAVVCLYLTTKFFYYGLSRYESASS
jgi:ABC-2 type transport system permease protein